MQKFLVFAFLAVLGAGPVLWTGTVHAQSLKDNFDGKVLDKTKWTVKQVLDGQIAFPAAGRCGAGIEITVRESDGGKQCDTDCQRAELRTVGSSWPIFGDEVWYRFSFRVSGDIAELGSRRFVIGQWKGPGDGSPMIAQRFDNGIFHITVQDNDFRRTIASAEGDADAIESAEQELTGLAPTLSKKPSRANIEITPEPNAMLPDPRKAWVDMVYRIKPGRTDNEYGPTRPGEIEVWANGKKIVSVKGNIGATLKKDKPSALKGPYFKFGIYRLRQPGVVRFDFDEFSQGSSQAMLAELCKVR